MPQFPENRLPENCDRRADYLWQRDSTEYFDKEPSCTEQFNGIDFLWMAALLLEHDDQKISHLGTKPEPPWN